MVDLTNPEVVRRINRYLSEPSFATFYDLKAGERRYVKATGTPVQLQSAPGQAYKQVIAAPESDKQEMVTLTETDPQRLPSRSSVGGTKVVEAPKTRTVFRGTAKEFEQYNAQQNQSERVQIQEQEAQRLEAQRRSAPTKVTSPDRVKSLFLTQSRKDNINKFTKKVRDIPEKISSNVKEEIKSSSQPTIVIQDEVKIPVEQKVTVGGQSFTKPGIESPKVTPYEFFVGSPIGIAKEVGEFAGKEATKGLPALGWKPKQIESFGKAVDVGTQLGLVAVPGVGTALVGAYTVEGATTALNPQETKTNRIIGGVTAGLGIVGGAYVGGRALTRLARTPIIKTEPLIVRQVQQDFAVAGKPTKQLVVEDVYGKKVSLQEFKVKSYAQEIQEGKFTTVNTRARELFKRPPVYSGNPYTDREGYLKALELLKKRGYTESQARSTLRLQSPRATEIKSTGTGVLISKGEGEPVAQFLITERVSPREGYIQVRDKFFRLRCRKESNIYSVERTSSGREFEGSPVYQDVITRYKTQLTKEGYTFSKLSDKGKTTYNLRAMTLPKQISETPRGIGFEIKSTTQQLNPLKKSLQFGEGKAGVVKGEPDITVDIPSPLRIIKEKTPKKLNFIETYHGTTRSSAENILKGGLKSGTEIGRSRGISGNLGEVFVTPNIERAKGYAARAVYGKPGAGKEVPAVIKVKLTKAEYDQALKAQGGQLGIREELKLTNVPKDRISIVGLEEPRTIKISEGIKTPPIIKSPNIISSPKKPVEVVLPKPESKQVGTIPEIKFQSKETINNFNKIESASLQKERVIEKPLELSRSGQKTNEGLQIKQQNLLKTPSSSKEELKLEQGQKEGLRTLQIQSSNLRSRVRNALSSKFKERFKFKEPLKSPKLFIPKSSFDSFVTKEVSDKKLKQAYDIVSYKGGKEFILGKNLPFGRAQKLGSEFVSKTLRASFKLKPSGTTRLQDVRFELNPRVFRPSKKDAERFVQRSKFRLSSGSEVSEIQTAKIRRRKAKRGFF